MESPKYNGLAYPSALNVLYGTVTRGERERYKGSKYIVYHEVSWSTCTVSTDESASSVFCRPSIEKDFNFVSLPTFHGYTRKKIMAKGGRKGG